MHWAAPNSWSLCGKGDVEQISPLAHTLAFSAATFISLSSPKKHIEILSNAAEIFPVTSCRWFVWEVGSTKPTNPVWRPLKATIFRLKPLFYFKYSQLGSHSHQNSTPTSCLMAGWSRCRRFGTIQARVQDVLCFLLRVIHRARTREEDEQLQPGQLCSQHALDGGAAKESTTQG